MDFVICQATVNSPNSGNLGDAPRAIISRQAQWDLDLQVCPSDQFSIKSNSAAYQHISKSNMQKFATCYQLSEYVFSTAEPERLKVSPKRPLRRPAPGSPEA